MFLAGLVLGLRLALPHPEEQITVYPERVDAMAALASTTVDAAELAALGPDPAAAMAFAMRRAGVFIGREQYFVDGLPADGLPRAAAIERIVVNADPFSAEMAGVDGVRIDVELRQPDRKWRFSASPPVLATDQHDVLTGRASPAAASRSGGVSGPVPGLPATFWLQGSTYSDQSTSAFLSAAPGDLVLDSSESRTSAHSVSVGGAAATRATMIRWMFQQSSSRVGGAGVGGMTSPAAGLDVTTGSRRFQTSWNARGGRLSHRGGLVLARASTDWLATSNAQARTYLGAFHTGGADTTADSETISRVTARHVIEGDPTGRPWLAGGEVSRDEIRDSPVPNPLGHLYLGGFDASRGTLIAQSGAPSLTATVTTAALFAQATPVRRPLLLLRVGARADWQAGEGTIVSPRATMAVRVGGLTITSGAGLFVESWPAALVMAFRKRDAEALPTRVIPDVAVVDPPSDVGGGDLLTLQVQPRVARRRDVVVQTAVTRCVGHVAVGFEHKWTRGFSMMGARRVRTEGQLVDLLDGDRHLARHQLHVRADVTAGRLSLTGHYEYVHSRDDVDFPLSLPARQDDLDGEWGPSTGLPGHNASFVTAWSLPRGVRAYATASVASGRPYSILTGRDPQGLATFVDRGGAPRNSLRAAGEREVSISASKRVRVPTTRLAVTIGGRVENLLNETNARVIAPWPGTGWIGRPLSASPGRSFSGWVTIAH